MPITAREQKELVQEFRLALEKAVVAGNSTISPDQVDEAAEVLDAVLEATTRRPNGETW